MGLPTAVYPSPTPKCPHRHIQRSTVQGNLNHVKVTVRITHALDKHCSTELQLSCGCRLWICSMSPIRWNTVFWAWLLSLSMVFVEFICVVAGLLLLLLFVVEWKDYKHGHAIFSHSFTSWCTFSVFPSKHCYDDLGINTCVHILYNIPVLKVYNDKKH